MNQNTYGLVRVLHVTNGMDRAGAETMLMNYYRCIDRTKLQFDFLLTTPLSYKCHYENEITEMGGKIFHLPQLTPYAPWKYLNAADIFFKDHPEYRVVHSHISATGVFPLYIAKRNNVSVRISHSHNTRGGKLLKHFVISILKLFLQHVGTHFFACGTDAAEWLYGKRFVLNNNVFILKNAIYASLYAYSEEKRCRIRMKKDWNDNFVIGHIGRFAYQKNHGFLLDIFKNIKKLCPHALLLLIGDGEERKVIEKKITVEGLGDSVVLMGVVDNVFDYMQAMDVFLFPSLYEGLGMALIEAQAAGLCCFASKDAVPREATITDLVEFISLSENAEYWANRIVRYKDGYVRRNTYNEIKKAFYDVQQNAEWLENYYIELFDSVNNL
jgi:glycosyltransferase involved in cell wall biosynthesis